MSNPTQLHALKQIIDGLRARLDELESHNEQLRDENLTLRQLLSQRAPTPMPPVSSFGEEVSRLDSVSDVHATMHGMASRSADSWARPTQRVSWHDTPTRNRQEPVARSTPPAAYDEYARTPQPAAPAPDESAYYGRALTPQQMTRAQLREIEQPAPSAGMPGFDLGYINQVSADALDALPYGLIVLDAQGNILFYNETESQLAGFSQAQVMGKNFFAEVAPCTRVKEFEGRFRQFVAGELGRVVFFDFAFHFRHGTQQVLIGVSHGRRKGHFNVMMSRKA